MKNKKFHIITLLVMIWNFSMAQQYTNYNVKDGLPSNHVYQLTQDAQGFIWMVTDKGIVKYNGRNFKTFTTRQGLPTNDIWGIHISGDNRVWYFSKSPKLGYIKNDSVYAFPSAQDGEVLNPVFQNVGFNNVLIGNSRVSHRLNDQLEWEKVENPHLDLNLIASFNHPRVAALSANLSNDSLYFIDKDHQFIKRFKRSKGLLSEPVKGQLNDSIAFWASPEGYTLCNLNTLEFYQRTFLEEIGDENVTFTRLINVNNQIQITGSGFVGVLDDQFHIREVTRFPLELNVHFAFIDGDETIWMASFNKGLFKYPKSKREIKYSLPSEKVARFNVVDEQLVASIYNRGFYIYDSVHRDFKPFLKEDGYILGAWGVDAIQTNFYLTGHKIIARKNGNTKVLFSGTNGLKLNNLGRQLVYLDGLLYGNFSGGINKIHPESLKVLGLYEQVGVYSLIVIRSQLYFGTPNGLKTIRVDKIQDVLFENAEFQKPILTLKKLNDGKLLITTDGYGAYLTNLKTIHRLEGTQFLSVQDAFVEENSIWLATDRGVLRYDRKGEEYIFQRRIEDSDGLPTRNINAISVINGQLIVGTDNGIAVLPKNAESTRRLLDLYFDRASFNDKPITIPQNSFLSEKENNANFTISSIDFSDGNTNFEYQYRLHPIQKEWISTTSGSLNFTDLSPNDYELQIKLGDISKSSRFTIEPRWWQTIWFKAIVVFTTLLLFGLILYFILKSIQKENTRKLIQEKQLAQIQLKALRSQMNPHFVFNSLAAIQYYINNNDFEASETYLVKFSKLIRTFFELSKESEITIDEEVKLLRNYLDLERLRFRGKFDYQINVDPKLNGKKGKIPAMLLQPIVENAVNHGIFNKEEKGIVTVDFRKVSDKELAVSITDDGVGFVNTQKEGIRKIKSSNVLQDRLFYLNQSLRWKIDYKTSEAFPELNDKGNVSIFTITKKQ